MVDPSAFGTFDLGAIMERGQRQQMNNLRMEEYRTEQANKRRLSELLPVAMGRGGISEGGALSQEDAISELYSVDPDIAMKLDEHQRAIAKEATSDLANAVRWADTPDKWTQVQEFYKTKGVDLSRYAFEGREQGLMALGKLGEYLDGAPKPEYRSVEAGGSLIDVSGGNPRVVIAPNDGSQQMGSPVRQAGGPEPGKVINGFRYKGGNPNDRNSWEPVNGGPTASQSGPFPASGY
jgi:hypothetical protein